MMRAAAAASSASAPKLDADSCSFIMKVQLLIERCLTFYLDQDECVKALHMHAQIDPIIAGTVWKELEKANKEFFEGYHCERVARQHANFGRAIEDTRQILEDISNKVKRKIPKS